MGQHIPLSSAKKPRFPKNRVSQNPLGGTQHAVGNIYPLLGSVALHPTYYWRAIAPTWGNPTRCGKHIPVVGFRCTPPNLLLESDRTYLGEPNTPWGNIYPLLGSVALHPTYYWRAIAPTWGNPTRCGKHIPVVGFRCTPPNLLLESDRTYLGEPNTPWGNIYPLLGSVALHPTYYWRAIAPTWGNPTRCGKHIPVVGFRCTPPNLLLESDRTYLGEPNTLWETYTRCWVPLHSTQPTTGERSRLPGGTQHAVGNIYPLLGSVALHPTYYWRAIAPTWGNPTPPGETYTPFLSQETRFFPKIGFLRTPLGEPNTLWVNIYPYCPSTNSEICEDTQL